MRHILRSLTALATLGSCVSIPSSSIHIQSGKGSQLASGSPMAREVTSPDDGFDQSDLSFITRLAAIGDSYSAGIGAGNRLGTAWNIPKLAQDWACSRYDQAYPYLIHHDERLGDPNNRNFQFRSCSGAITTDVVEKQIPTIDANQQAILVSAGGNDAELVNILNQCIYQWASINAAKVEAIKAQVAIHNHISSDQNQIDWDALGLDCDAQLARTKRIIETDAFSHKLDLGHDLSYWFWAEDLSTECDTVSWTSIIYTSQDSFNSGQRLTRDHRRTMNGLVDAVNAKLSAAAVRAGASVKFVEYDEYVGQFNGRFCEAGVDESSSSQSNSRPVSMFYEMNTWDFLGSDTWKRSDDTAFNYTFEGAVNQLAMISLLVDPGARLIIGGNVDTANNRTAAIKVAANKDFGIPKPLPDGYGRVFHPQPLLHQIIANKVIYHMSDLNAQRHGFPAVPEALNLGICSTVTGNEPGANDLQAAMHPMITFYKTPPSSTDSWEPSDYEMDLAVAKALPGPDAVVDENWTRVIREAIAAKHKIFGYVRTGYLGSSKQLLATRTGSINSGDWYAQALADVDTWYSLFGEGLAGIVLDEAADSCQAANAYRILKVDIKTKYKMAKVVLKTSLKLKKCFDDAADLLLYDVGRTDGAASPSSVHVNLTPQRTDYAVTYLVN
ncbi:hypothetical protein K461DRAFT_270289 [Myriangium duriaei CBS 260.36]|uniref:SGNH hydrolase-type esterase domain-containing protein n=1 Tax=Myriangium duriaei CBS 260.36 TaxID=1168546 RepID=A0A9P4J1W7_9PEZI|nr:hypothetical protein K461DRAFT_270289 [Myriangium duriaei CBS 260.36]